MSTAATPRARRQTTWWLIAGLLAVAVIGVLLAGRGGGPADSTAPSTSSTRAARPTTTTTPRSSTSSTKASSSRQRSTTTTNRPTTFGTDPLSGLRLVAEASLNRQASDTLRAIRNGGPFRFPRNDGVTYFNNNRVLPSRRRGYYREYTVVTPGASNRGARRIVTGADGELYYTDDHYDTFVRIKEDQ